MRASCPRSLLDESRLEVVNTGYRMTALGLAARAAIFRRRVEAVEHGCGDDGENDQAQQKL